MLCLRRRTDRNSTLNPTDTEYVCCFERLHAKTGSSLIAIFHIVVSTVILSWVARSLVTGGKSQIEAGFQIILTSFVLIISFVLFAGLKCESRRVIIVYIISQVAAISLLFMLFLALIMGLKAGILHDPGHNGYKTIEEEMLIVAEILCSLALVALEVWFLSVVLQSYRYITNKHHYFGVGREQNL